MIVPYSENRTAVEGQAELWKVGIDVDYNAAAGNVVIVIVVATVRERRVSARDQPAVDRHRFVVFLINIFIDRTVFVRVFAVAVGYLYMAVFAVNNLTEPLDGISQSSVQNVAVEVELDIRALRNVQPTVRENAFAYSERSSQVYRFIAELRFSVRSLRDPVACKHDAHAIIYRTCGRAHRHGCRPSPFVFAVCKGICFFVLVVHAVLGLVLVYEHGAEHIFYARIAYHVSYAYVAQAVRFRRIRVFRFRPFACGDKYGGRA